MECTDYTGYRSIRDTPAKPMMKYVEAIEDGHEVFHQGRRCYVKIQTCAFCGAELPDGCDWDYCPSCGQRIEWEHRGDYDDQSS